MEMKKRESVSKGVLTPEEASEYLGGVALRTLDRWRQKGIGPIYVKMGRLVRYRVSDLEDYLDARSVSPERRDRDDKFVA